MHVIDSKGRLFGKINIIDFMVIVIIIMAGIVSVRFFLSKENAADETFVVEITPRIRSPWFFQAISVGDTEEDNEGTVIAKIIGKNPVNTVLAAEIRGKKRRGDLVFKGNELKVGSQITIETGTVVILGVISDIQSRKKGEAVKAEDWRIETKSVIVVVQLDSKNPWFLEAIQVGDKEIREQDGENVVIAEIIAKKSAPSKVLITKDDNIIVGEHPFERDIVLTVKLRCQVLKGELIFKRNKIKVGGFINIETEKSSIRGVVSHVRMGSSSL